MSQRFQSTEDAAMETNHIRSPQPNRNDGWPSGRVVAVTLLAMILLLLLGMFSPRPNRESRESKTPTNTVSAEPAGSLPSVRGPASFSRRSTTDKQLTPEEIVAAKL